MKNYKDISIEGYTRSGPGIYPSDADSYIYAFKKGDQAILVGYHSLADSYILTFDKPINEDLKIIVDGEKYTISKNDLPKDYFVSGSANFGKPILAKLSGNFLSFKRKAFPFSALRSQNLISYFDMVKQGEVAIHNKILAALIIKAEDIYKISTILNQKKNELLKPDNDLILHSLLRQLNGLPIIKAFKPSQELPISGQKPLSNNAMKPGEFNFVLEGKQGEFEAKGQLFATEYVTPVRLLKDMNALADEMDPRANYGRGGVVCYTSKNGTHLPIFEFFAKGPDAIIAVVGVDNKPMAIVMAEPNKEPVVYGYALANINKITLKDYIIAFASAANVQSMEPCEACNTPCATKTDCDPK